MGRAFEVRKAAMAKTSAAKAKVYSRFGKEIYMAAKNGEPDPEMNLTLRRVIEKARAQNVPADVIKRAVEKAKGGSGEDYTDVRYEGFGPGAATVIVECMTDNVNRTVAEVRNCFNKTHGKLGVSGSVLHAYEHVGMLSFAYPDEEKVLEVLLEHEVDVQDIEKDGDHLNVTVAPADLYKAKDAIDEVLGPQNYDVLEVTFVAQDSISLDGEDKERFERLLNMLDAIDDVQQVYHNVTDDTEN